MGNFHCITSTCARVVYREYLPPVVRWRYPGEAEWQEIEGDDYTIKNLPGQCCNSYDVTVSYEIVNCNGKVVNSDTATVRIPNAIYQSVDYLLTTGFARTQIVVKYFDCIQKKQKQKSIWASTAKSDLGVLCTSSDATYSKGLSKWELIDLVRADGQPDECKTCTFTAFKNDAIVHQETREDCPEVEQLPCHLSDISKEIKIEKLANLERVEVRNQDINIVFLAPLNTPLIDSKPLPDNCLNIYKTFTTAPPFLSNFIPLPGAINPYEYIEQICSAEGCPPPEYEVICDCTDKCPEGTCEILCGSYICCVDPVTGDSIKSIFINEFFPYRFI